MALGLATAQLANHSLVMSKMQTIAAALILSALVAPAFAACPAPTAPDDTPENLAQQRERLICLQNEIANTSEERKQEVDIRALDRSVEQIQLQRKFDALNFTPPQL